MNVNKYSWLSMLIIRITLGVVFMQSGWGKIHNIDRVVAYFTELGIPYAFFSAHLTAWTELISGLFILVGLMTRAASISLLIVMTVAIIKVQFPELENKSDLFGTIEFLYALMFFILVLNGAGLVSIDHLIKEKLKSKKTYLL